MTVARITAVEDSIALLLPKDFLEKLGIDVGDELSVSVEDRTLIARPIERQQPDFEEMVEELLERRHWAYEKLAEGPE